MSTDDPDNPLPDLVEELENVDEDTPDGELNETTISDNNGGRIELDGDDETIRK